MPTRWKSNHLEGVTAQSSYVSVLLDWREPDITDIVASVLNELSRKQKTGCPIKTETLRHIPRGTGHGTSNLEQSKSTSSEQSTGRVLTM